MEPQRSEIEKSYPPRGPMHQFRFKEIISFYCFRCAATKKSKLITILNEDWSQRLCNGCYGYLLSVYEIKARTGTEDEKASALADLLLAVISKDRAKEVTWLFRLSEKRSEYLSKKALRFVATSEYVSNALEGTSSLDWSPATIGLCKAVEVEVVERLLDPLAPLLRSSYLDNDVRDKDIGRVAKYLTASFSRPPELGSFAHFLQTAINSQSRRTTSPVIHAFFTLVQSLPLSHWILDANGLYQALAKLTREYRNKAAHTEELTRADYESCRDYIIGEVGILWRLVLATQPHRRKTLDQVL